MSKNRKRNYWTNDEGGYITVYAEENNIFYPFGATKDDDGADLREVIADLEMFDSLADENFGSMPHLTAPLLRWRAVK